MQLIYEYFARVDSVRYEETVFEDLWSRFSAEVEDADWVDRGVANLRYFNCDRPYIDLGDGITIRGRDSADLGRLGFGPPFWERISDDWSGMGASSFVLVVEHSYAKKPDNSIFLDSFSVGLKATRALQALRLTESGSITIGRMFLVKASRFNVGMGGIHSVGASIPGFGPPYAWTERVGQVYPSIYRALAQLEKDGYDGPPGNLEIAIRTFMGTYDRWPQNLDSQLLDCITSLEALLGTGSELSFRLSFRVASLLAANDQERAALLRLIREFYDTRSRVVHGGKLNERHHERLRRVDELRSIVRRLLRAFVAFAVSPDVDYGKTVFKDLDETLVDASEREKLRTALRTLAEEEKN